MRGGFDLDDGRLPGIGRLVRDFMLGGSLFLVLFVALHWGGDWLGPSRAAASELVAQRIVDMTGPAGPARGNAVFAAARPPVVASLPPADLRLVAVVGLTFALMFAANAALYRHIRQVHVGRRHRS